MIMPTDVPPVDLKVESLSELHEEEGANVEPTFHMIVSFHIEMGR